MKWEKLWKQAMVPLDRYIWWKTLVDLKFIFCTGLFKMCYLMWGPMIKHGETGLTSVVTQCGEAAWGMAVRCMAALVGWVRVVGNHFGLLGRMCWRPVKSHLTFKCFFLSVTLGLCCLTWSELVVPLPLLPLSRMDPNYSLMYFFLIHDLGVFVCEAVPVIHRCAVTDLLPDN